HAPFPHPAHRTGRAQLRHPALRRASQADPQVHPTAHLSPAHTARSATAKPWLGLLDLAVNPRAFGRFQSAPEVRLLPSTGITRLPRYYEPVRHPSAGRPVPRGRPVGSVVPPLGLPVLPVDCSSLHAIARTPAGLVELCRSGLDQRRPSPSVRWVGSRIARFEVCSAFTRVMACRVADSPGSRFLKCFSPSRYLLEPLQVLPVGATSYRARFAPARINTLLHGTRTGARTQTAEILVPDYFTDSAAGLAEKDIRAPVNRKGPLNFTRLGRRNVPTPV